MDIIDSGRGIMLTDIYFRESIRIDMQHLAGFFVIIILEQRLKQRIAPFISDLDDFRLNFRMGN